MAVIISDMEHIPDSCFNCDFHNYHFCDMTGNCIEENMDNGTRADDCPLKEVNDNSVLEEIKADIHKAKELMKEHHYNRLTRDAFELLVTEIINRHMSGKDRND